MPKRRHARREEEPTGRASRAPRAETGVQPGTPGRPGTTPTPVAQGSPVRAVPPSVAAAVADRKARR
jgi:hypothetical protein